MSNKQGKEKKDDDQMVRGLYSEISLRKAMSKQHMKSIEKQRKSKKAQAVSYLNFREKIFYLDQVLDHTFWNFHNSFLKTKYVPCFQNQSNDFIAIDSGMKVSHLQWVNTIDSQTPY